MPAVGSVEAALRVFHEGQKRMLRMLDERLLAPVRELLQREGVDRVVFVPHRALAGLPLHAVSYKHDGVERCWLDDFTVSNAPSATVLRRLVARDTERPLGRAGFALVNPIPPGGLDDARPAVDALRGLLPEVVLHQGARARSHHLFDLAEGPALVHVACHGKYDPDDPFGARLEFRRLEAPDGTPFMETVNVLDLLEDLRLPGTWHATLAACESSLANSELASSDAFSLAQAFLVAGSASVWSTLWSVDHAATSRVLERAYELLVEQPGLRKAAALRAAQLDVRRRWPEPFYWAGVQHVGAP